ncbi:MAG: hypothetical protein ACTSWP_03655 [Candidatus Freyarchaeota archaeon]
MRRLEEGQGPSYFLAQGKGEHTEESDIDICLVASYLPDDVFKRRHPAPSGYKLVSVMGFHPDEFLSMLSRGNPLILDIVKYGVVLHDDGFFEKAREVYLETVKKYGLKRDGRGWTWRRNDETRMNGSAGSPHP